MCILFLRGVKYKFYSKFHHLPWVRGTIISPLLDVGNFVSSALVFCLCFGFGFWDKGLPFCSELKETDKKETGQLVN
jgi:hypothetical protein